MYNSLPSSRVLYFFLRNVIFICVSILIKSLRIVHSTTARGLISLLNLIYSLFDRVTVGKFYHKYNLPHRLFYTFKLHFLHIQTRRTSPYYRCFIQHLKNKQKKVQLIEMIEICVEIAIFPHN